MRALASVLWTFLNLWLAIAAFQLELTTNGFVAYCIFLVMLFIAVICHEAGHAVAARRVGANVLTIAALVGEYDFARRKFGPMRRMRRREIAGFVLYTWPLGAGTHRKEAIIAAAGPLANFAAAALAVAMVPLFAPTLPTSPTVQVTPVTAAIANARHPDVVTAAQLPNFDAAKPSIDQLRQNYRHEPVRRFVEAALQVFALLSVGMAMINLVPFDGSDGEKLRGHLFPKRRRVKR